MPESKEQPSKENSSGVDEIDVEGFDFPIKVINLPSGARSYAFTRADGTIEAAHIPAGDIQTVDEAEEKLFAERADRPVAEDKWTLDANNLVIARRHPDDVLQSTTVIAETEPGIGDQLAQHFETADTHRMPAVWSAPPVSPDLTTIHPQDAASTDTDTHETAPAPGEQTSEHRSRLRDKVLGPLRARRERQARDAKRVRTDLGEIRGKKNSRVPQPPRRRLG